MIIENDRKIAEELKQRFLAADGDRILRVILYGSRAQGIATEESDFDFLVVEKDPVLKRQEMRVYARLSRTSIVLSTCGLWESRSSRRRGM